MNDDLNKKILLLENLIKDYSRFLDFSQFGEERVILNLFRKIQKNNIKFNSFYMDIGAYNPILFSNTFALYRHGWKGLVVDPNESKMQNWHNIRPNDIVVTKAVMPDNYDGEYVEMISDSPLSAIEAVSSPLNKRKKLNFENMQKSYRSKCIKFKDLMDHSYNLNLYPSFLNMDIEGLEESIAIHSDIAKYKIPILCIEHAISEFSDKFSLLEYKHSTLVKYFEQNNYYLVSICALSLIFCHKDFFYEYL